MRPEVFLELQDAARVPGAVRIVRMLVDVDAISDPLEDSSHRDHMVRLPAEVLAEDVSSFRTDRNIEAPVRLVKRARSSIDLTLDNVREGRLTRFVLNMADKTSDRSGENGADVITIARRDRDDVSAAIETMTNRRLE